MPLFSKENIIAVTGASSGIGRAVCINLVNEGATVIGIARNLKHLEETKALCSAPESFHIEQKDLSDDISHLDVYVKELKDKYGKLTGLAYCAGAMLLKPTAATSYEESKNLFDINYFAPLMMMKGFVDKRNNIGRGATAVAIASAEAFLKEKGLCIYSATKAALRTSLAVLAKENAQKEIRINTVSPSDIKTPMTMNENMVQIRADREKIYPLGYGEPENVASLVVFLLSSKSKWITAQDYVVDCGSF